MPTIAGIRRRGFTPESIKAFCAKIGVTKFNSLTDIALFEHCVRDDLNKRALRVMGVLNPLKVVIENYPEGQVEELEAINNPEDPDAGSRTVPFSHVLYIDADDFCEDPPKKYFRLAPGREVRLRYGYFIMCKEVVKDENGEIIEIKCVYDPATKGGNAPDGRKVKGTIHWVSAERSVEAEVRLYDRLFLKENPSEVEDGGDYKDNLNPESLTVLQSCRLEPSLLDAKPGVPYQFERVGYFCLDSRDATKEKPVFNRTISLRDSWAKIKGKNS
jgi:glutaminyl-tRNA synthetase